MKNPFKPYWESITTFYLLDVTAGSSAIEMGKNGFWEANNGNS